MKNKKLLVISTDRLIFDEKSNVRSRQIEYAKDWKEVHIIIFAVKKDYSNQKISENCWIYSTDSVSKFFFPFDAVKIGKKIIKENDISEITCQDASLTAVAGFSLKKNFAIPLEIQVHGDISSLYFQQGFVNKLRFILSKKYLPKADKIRVVSNRIRIFVEELINKKIKEESKRPKIEVRPIFVDKESIKVSPVIIDLKRKYKQFNYIVLMASRLEKEKDIELAINAWPLVLNYFPNSGLLIVGEGSQEEYLKKLVVSKHLVKSVIFEKWADKQTLYSYYKTADLFLNTSLFEGYGMTLVEAEAANCKIVSTDVGVANEVGAIISEHNKDDLAKKIMIVLSSINHKNDDQ